MDAGRFDALSRSLANRKTRRSALKGIGAGGLAAGLLSLPGSELVLESVMTNALRTGLYVTLKEMGASIETIETRNDGEEVADLRVKFSQMKGVDVPPSRAPSTQCPPGALA